VHPMDACRMSPSVRIGVGILFFGVILTSVSVQGADVRDRTRPTVTGTTTVTESQASDLTLTLTEADNRLIQTWIRTAGKVGDDGRSVTAFVQSPEADLVQLGQRVRSFPVEFISQMNQAQVTRVERQESGALLEIRLSGPAPSNARNYLLEIVTERGPYLSIPNVAIIEEEQAHIVYVQTSAGEYVPRAIETGLQGELYTQVIDGLDLGDQVVSIGSFFVDAENKLNADGMAAMPGMDHGSMVGMDHDAMGPGEADADGVLAGPEDAAIAELRLDMTDPAPDSTVGAPLPMIHLMFNAAVDPSASQFEITSDDGRIIELMPPMSMGNSGNMLMAMPTSPLEPGDYQMKWRTTGADSNVLEGEFTFTVE